MGEFPTAVDVAKLEFPDLHKRLRRWSIGHLSADQCQCIHEAARRSVGLREGLAALRLEMRQTLSALNSVEQKMKEIEQAQAETLRKVPYAEQLLSIPRLGSMTVATILGETGDLRGYRHADAVIKMAGLNLYTRASGTFRGKTRITKRGRPLLRRVLYLAAVRLSRSGLPLAEFHGRLSARIEKPQVFVAACRKLVRVMMALVRDDVRYQERRLAVPIRMKPAA
jgi:transposase